MAITINGSGTITGVSAGGLPDGSVDADTLASTLDISDKTVDFGLVNGDLPSNSILKVWETAQNTYISNSDSSTYDSIFPNLSVTTTKANSKLIYMCFLSGVAFANSNARMSLKIGYNGASTEVARDAGYTLNDTRFMQSIAHATGTIASAGTTITANMYYTTVSNGNAVYINKPYTGAGRSQLIILEVAG